MPMIGFLNAAPGAEAMPDLVAEFRRGLAEAGYVEGKNLTIECRFANFRPELLPEAAGDLVRLNMRVIFPATHRRLPRSGTPRPAFLSSGRDNILQIAPWRLEAPRRGVDPTWTFPRAADVAGARQTAGKDGEARCSAGSNRASIRSRPFGASQPTLQPATRTPCARSSPP
jgi:hypothetical protein